MRFAFRWLKLVIEPGGAVSLAALLSGKVEAKGLTTGIVLSGGNVDPGLFSEIIEGRFEGELQSLIGQEVGVSRWFALDQARIDAFAGLTEDEQFIHVDPERAKATPFGGTIAHGFLTLSLASAMSMDAIAPLDDLVMGVNYGFDRLRFLAPAPSGSRVRGRFKLLSAEDKGGGRWLLKHELTVEIEGGDKPALIAEWLTMQVVKA
ncbi:hypothetical protein LTR94_027990 [Friedmanniomyces endolithicus]|nr:hypothetical protein LTR94_027990 [Friedmanniomyces endolithicus]